MHYFSFSGTHLSQCVVTCPIHNHFSVEFGTLKSVKVLRSLWSFVSCNFLLSRTIAKIAKVEASRHTHTATTHTAKTTSTHNDCLVEETTGKRRFADCTNTATTSTLSEYHYIVRVATELCNVFLNPFQRFDLVENAIVARNTIFAFCREFRVSKESEYAKTIVDCYKNNVFVAPFLTIEFGLCAKTFTIATTVNPNCNRKFCVNLARSFCPNVQIKAIFRERCFVAIAPFGVVTTFVLNVLVTWVGKTVTYLNTFPRSNWLWSLPAQIAYWRCSVRNAAINKHAFGFSFNTLNLTALDSEHRILRVVAAR